jgi:hypothetical protein
LRGPERLRCEHHQDRSGFALILSTPGGGSITQRFSDAAELFRRRVALERTLASTGWVTEQASTRA